MVHTGSRSRTAVVQWNKQFLLGFSLWKSWAWTQVNPCGICGWQMSTGRGFPLITSVFLSVSFLPMQQYHSFIHPLLIVHNLRNWWCCYITHLKKARRRMSDWLGAILDTTPGMSKLQSKGWKHPLKILSLACGVIFRHNLLRHYCADKNKCMKFWIPSMSTQRPNM